MKRARKSVVDQIKEGSKQIIGDKPETGMTLKAAKKKFSEKQGKRHDGGKDKQRTEIAGKKDPEDDDIEEYDSDEETEERHNNNKDRNEERPQTQDSEEDESDQYDEDSGSNKNDDDSDNARTKEKEDDKIEEDDYDLTLALPRHLRGKRKNPPSPAKSADSQGSMEEEKAGEKPSTPYQSDTEESIEDPDTPTKSNRKAGKAGKDNSDPSPTKRTYNPYFTKKKKPAKFTKTMDEINGRTKLQRFDIRVFVPESDDPVGTLRDTLLGALLQLQQADPGVALCPYRMEDKALPLVTKESNFPQDVTGMMAYFPGVTPNPKGRTNYAKVLLAFNKDWTTIKTNTAWWMQVQGHGIWKRTIQYERVDCMGWLLYSHRNIDLDHLKHEIFHQTQITVGLRYRVVKTGEYRKQKVPMEDMVRAIHIEVASHELAEAERQIRDAYAADSQDFPGDIRMRLVPEYSGYLNMKSKEKIKHLAAKQHAWINNIRTARTWEIMSLDLASKENGKSIRQMIMETPVPGKATKMFHSIGMGYQGQGILLNFLPQYEAEGRMMVAGLLPYLKWKHGEWVEKYFSDSAVVRAQSSEWDEITQMVISANDKALDSLTDVDKDLDLTTGVEQQSYIFENTPGGNRRNVPAPGDDDSVSTFRTAGLPKGTQDTQQGNNKDPHQSYAPGFNSGQFPNGGNAKNKTKSRDDATHTSSISWNSKVSTLESEMNTVRSDVSQMQTSVASVEERMVGMADQMAQMMSLLGKIAENNTSLQGQHPGNKHGGSAGGGSGPAGGR